MFAYLLIPFPLPLNVPRGILHVHLLLALAFELLLSVLLFAVPLPLLVTLRKNQLMHLGHLTLVLLALVMNLVTVLLKGINFLLSGLILSVCLLLEKLGLRLDELSNAITHQVLSLQLIFKHRDPLLELLLFFVEDALLAAEFALGFSLTVLHIQLLLGLSLVDLLLQIEDLLVVLILLLPAFIIGTLLILG
jgi:hypothetical protein